MAELVPLAGFEADVRAVYEWREEQQTGAGDEFYAKRRRGLGQLEHFPNSGSRIKGSSLRRLLVCENRFAVIHVPESRGILLHALFDQLADPAFNARRIREITQRLNKT